jgi:cysteinyl-tRNA synthetase
MHNNFLVDRTGKMSKSSGEFLRLQLLIDRGYHPLAYRLMCLQAHYRSELEFSWEGLHAALVRLKRMVATVEHRRLQQGQQNARDEVTLDQFRSDFAAAINEDVNTPLALTVLDRTLEPKSGLGWDEINLLSSEFDSILGLQLGAFTRTDLRIRPKAARITEAEIEAALARRKEARAAKDFATSDSIRDELTAQGVEVMDGDPLGWEWKLQ